MNKLGIVLLASVLHASFLTLPLTAKNPEDIVVKGKGFQIKQADLDEMWARIEVENMNFGRLIPSDEVEFRQAALLETMIFTRLVLARATDEDRTRGRERADKAIADIRQRLGTEANFHRQVSRSGMDESTFRTFKLEEATVLAVVDREVKSKIEIPDTEVRKYYDQNLDTFTTPETFRVAHILISTRNSATGETLTTEQRKEKRLQAEALLARARQGENFAELARKYSEDVNSKASGGETTFAAGRAVVEFEAAAAALQPGELSGVVETQFGYHVIKLIEHRQASRIPFAEAGKDIRELLAGRELQGRVAPWAEQLQKDAGTQYLPGAPKKKKPGIAQ